MKLYAVMYTVRGEEVLLSDTISTNLRHVQGNMVKRQSQDDEGVYYVATFEQTEKLTPPVTEWTSEKLVVSEVIR